MGKASWLHGFWLSGERIPINFLHAHISQNHRTINVLSYPLTTNGWISIFSHVFLGIAGCLGQPKGTLFCTDTAYKEINRRSGKIMESPLSGLPGRHRDNSVSPASKRFAVFCCFWWEKQWWKSHASHLAPEPGVGRWASDSSQRCFPHSEKSIFETFFVFVINYCFITPFRNANKSNGMFICVLAASGSNNCAWRTFFLSPFSPPSSIQLLLLFPWNNYVFENLDLKKTSFVASNCYIQPFLAFT